MSDPVLPRLGQRYAIQRGGETIVGECAMMTAYQVGLRIEDEAEMRWVSHAELLEIEEQEDEVPSLAECMNMLAIVMAALEHHAAKETT